MRHWRWLISAAAVATFAVAPAQAIPVAAITALGVSSIFVATAIAIVLNVGLAILTAKLFAPKIKQQDRQASVTTLQLGEQSRIALFGTAATAGSLVDAFNYGGTYGTDWEVVILALADHRCAALEGFYVNDTYVAYTSDGPVAGYNGQLEVYWLPGTLTQTMPSIVTTHGPGWTSSDNLAGVCGLVVAYKADAPTASNPIWTAGRPSFLPVVKGAFCYDARKDSTVTGGSGAHRWADPTTWEWSENPIVCRYNWSRGIYAGDQVTHPEMLLIGRGLTATQQPPENVAAYANICDEQVPSPGGGTENRYRIGGVVNAGDQYITTEEFFAAACAGIIIQPQGAVEIEPGHAKTSVATITDDDIVSTEKAAYSGFRSESDSLWSNTVIPRYIEPAQKWADHAAPIRRVYGDVIADGKPREDTLTLSLVTLTSQAQRCAEVTRRLGRLLRTATLTLGPRFAFIEEGDWITWNSARRTDGEPALFRVEAYQLSKEWRNTIQIREVASTLFDFAATDYIADGAVAVQQTAPDPAAYTPTRGAHQIATQTVAFPMTSTSTVISVAAFSAVLDDGSSFDFPAGSLAGLTASTMYGVFWDASVSDYSEQVEPAATLMASATCTFIGWQATSDTGGTYPTTPTPPAGSGGTGRNPNVHEV